MKILQINKFNYLRGGAEKYYLDLSSALSNSGHEVARFSMDHPLNESSEWSKYFVSNVTYNHGYWRGLKAAGRMFYSLEAMHKMNELLDVFQPDVAHVHNIYHQISPSVMDVLRKRGVPIVMHLHDYKPFCPARTMYNHLGLCERCRGGAFWHCTVEHCVKNSYLKSALSTAEMYLHHSLMKVYEKNVSLFISSSEFMRNKAIEWGLPEAKVVVQPYFIDLPAFEANLQPGNYLLYFGRLAEEKGVDTLIKAMIQCPNERLKIVGDGPERSSLELLVSDSGLSGRVEFLGKKTGGDLWTLIREAKAVVVPSQWYEVFGLVNVEAMACAKPVIGARIGGISELIDDGQDGFLFEAANVDDLARKIKLLNSADIPKMGNLARQKSLKYGQAEHLEVILNLYSKQAQKSIK